MVMYHRGSCVSPTCPYKGTHWHEVDGDDVIWREGERPDPPSEVRPTPGLGGLPTDPDGPEYPGASGLAPDVLGMKLLVYGLCAAIVLACLAYLVWTFWPAGV